LYGIFFRSSRIQIRGYHDLLGENSPSLLMLSWISISIASLMILSICLDFLAWPVDCDRYKDTVLDAVWQDICY
jgi:hypothetical protein